MTALTQDFNAPETDGIFRSIPVAANVKILKGAIVVLSGGYAAPGTTATGLLMLGRAERTVDNTGGAAGALSVRVKRGIFAWNSAGSGDAITSANIGATAYIVDDNTVALTNGSNTRSAAGTIHDIDSVSGSPFIKTP